MSHDLRDALIGLAFLVPLMGLFFAERSERTRRWVCRRWGHDWRAHHHGAPVLLPFPVCARCGKFERVALEEAFHVKADQGEWKP